MRLDQVVLAAKLLGPGEARRLCDLFDLPGDAPAAEVQRLVAGSPVAAAVLRDYLMAPSRARTPPRQRLQPPAAPPPAPRKKRRLVAPPPPPRAAGWPEIGACKAPAGAGLAGLGLAAPGLAPPPDTEPTPRPLAPSPALSRSD